MGYSDCIPQSFWSFWSTPVIQTRVVDRGRGRIRIQDSGRVRRGQAISGRGEKGEKDRKGLSQIWREGEMWEGGKGIEVFEDW